MTPEPPMDEDDFKRLTSSQKLHKDIERYSVRFHPDDDLGAKLEKLSTGVNNSTRISLETKRGVEHAISESKEAQKFSRETRQLYEDRDLVIQKLEERNKQMDHYLEIISRTFDSIREGAKWSAIKFLKTLVYIFILIFIFYCIHRWTSFTIPPLQ